MSSDVLTIDQSIELLEIFQLKLSDEKDINYLKLLHQTPAVAVIGLVSRGKSTLINKLIGLDLLSTGPNPVSFGNGFISHGRLRAEGYLRDGKTIQLPTTPSSFKERSRRYESQDLVDFKYTGPIRLPGETMLIDTKGLDEISSHFKDELLQLERSWATQGAMAALLVTSVPPGMSAQDAYLYQAVNEHFSGQVIVVVKQTDASLSMEDIQEAASVWRDHGAEVVVISDGTPSQDQNWGTGPLANLEQRLSLFWSAGKHAQIDAVTHLSQSLVKLARKIVVPTKNVSFSRLQLDKLWQKLDQGDLIPEIQEIVKTRLCQHYAAVGIIPTNQLDFQLTMRFASIGSHEALSHLQKSLKGNSQLRRVMSISEIILEIDRNIPKNFKSIIQSYAIESPDDCIVLSRVVDTLKQRRGNWESLSHVCGTWLVSTNSESAALGILLRGGDSLIPSCLAYLISLWGKCLNDWNLTLAPKSVLEEALNKNREAIYALSVALSSQVKSILLSIDLRHAPLLGESTTTWGLREIQRYENSEGSQPFSDLTAYCRRLEKVLDRLSTLTHFLDKETQAQLHETSVKYGPNSARRFWSDTALEKARYNLEYRDAYITFSGWSTTVLSVLAVLTAFSGHFARSIFLGVSAGFSAYVWNHVKACGIFVIKPYSDDTAPKTLKEEQNHKFIAGFLLVAMLGVASAYAGAVVPDQDNAEPVSKNSEYSTPVTDLQTTSTSSSLIETTVATTTSLGLAEAFISSSDLTRDYIQDGRGNPIESLVLPSDIASRVSYSFGLRDEWVSLPTEINSRFCWVGENSVLDFCAIGLSIRFTQVTTSVNYGLTVPIPSELPVGSYKLVVSFTGIGGSFSSLSSLEVIENTSLGATSSSLPYLTKRNEYWNADCPKNLNKNELLPLRLCDEGRGVKRVQDLLGLDSDGRFGNTTHNALLDFQSEVGLPPTGVVDRDTWFLLDRSQRGPGRDVNGDGLVTPDEFR
jgi:hypothetical protein